MPLDEAIRKRGFRRWYERQLYESHAHLVTGLLSLIMMALAVEMIEFRKSAGGFVALVAIAAGGCGLCIYTWRRFTLLLSRAEYLAGLATCRVCQNYGRLEILVARHAPDAVAGCALDVKCRQCGHTWTIV